MPKNCPKCGLSSPDIAERCDCGFDFLTKRVERSYVERSPDSGIKHPSIITGWSLLAGLFCPFVVLYSAYLLCFASSGMRLNEALAIGVELAVYLLGPHIGWVVAVIGVAVGVPCALLYRRLK